MIIFKTAEKLSQQLASLQKKGCSIGFIPTMGALHKGHISLIEQAKQDNQSSVCSIFVNPAQFNDLNDFQQYPNTIAEDIALLESSGCDILFLPSVSEIYPDGMNTARVYDFGFLETVYEGLHRPGHFKGVGKVMAILLDIVRPDSLYMGSKDYQQCMVVKDLCRQMGISDQLNFVACPTEREPDGLALSSRNKRLNESQRAIAGIIYQCLVSVQSKMLTSDTFDIVKKECTDLMLAKGIKPEYVSIANADTLEPMEVYDMNKPMVALIAAYIGDVRLIDNMRLN